MEIKMKKFLVLILVLTLAVFAMASCGGGNTDPKETAITLDADGGTLASSTLTVTNGAAYTLPTPTKTGYTFDGWYNGTTKVESTGTWALEDATLTLKAKWTANTSTIALNADGGVLENTSLTVTYGAAYTLPTPTRVGYTFDGWYAGDTKVEATGTWTSTDATVTYVAKWTAKTTAVTLDPNGGVLADTALTATYGSAYTLPEPTYEGYIFSGWYNGETKVTLTGNWAIEAATVTLTATWVEDPDAVVEVAVTLDPDGGVLADTSFTAILGETYELATPTKTGYNFAGWYYNGTAIEATGTWSIDAETVTLVAEWTAKETNITLDANGGTATDAFVTLVYGDTYELPTPVRTGYTFDGWFAGDVKVEATGTWASEDETLTLVAGWTLVVDPPVVEDNLDKDGWT